MKRYGYKFHVLDGKNTKASDIRFFAGIFAFVAFIASHTAVDVNMIEVYLLSVFSIFLLSMLSEVTPDWVILVIPIFALVSAASIYGFQPPWLSKYTDPEEYRIASAIFGVYSILVSSVSVFTWYRQKS